MTLMTLTRVGVTLSDPLFSDLSLTLSKGDRLGLVAANGRGKTSLLNAMAGVLEPTQGEITYARGLRVGYVRQDIPAESLGQSMHALVCAALPPDQAEYESWRADVVLHDLSVPYEVQHRPLETLSGGWQRTALLAAAWVAEPDLLLLDEPTNHLDLHRIALLQNWLAALPRETPVVMTSHDRAFLDETTNRTLFLRPERSRIFAVPYSAARTALAEADAEDERRFANERNKAQQLRKQAAKLKNIGVNSGSDLLLTKTRQLSERADRLEASARPAHREQSAGEIRLGNAGSHARALITLENAEVRAPDGRLLYRTGQKWISPGDRVVLLGSNGTGKTRLVNLIAAALDASIAGVKCAASIRAGFSDQHLGQLDGTQTPMHCITQAFDIGDQRARAVLVAAGIAIQKQQAPVAALSGGQKARLAMLVLRLQQPNFYLLDEPTNHLDIEGQEALEHELTENSPACLLVSHDRQFVQNVGNRFWWVRDGKLDEVPDPQPFLASEMSGEQA